MEIIEVKIFFEGENGTNILNESVTKLSEYFKILSNRITDYWKIPEYQIIIIECMLDKEINISDVACLFGEPWVFVGFDKTSVVSSEETVFTYTDIKWMSITFYDQDNLVTV